MADMGVKEVLSVLGQMDLELTQLQAQKRGLQHIREVLTLYEAKASELAEIEQRIATVASKAETLESRYDAKKAKERQALDDEHARCAQDADACKATAMVARKQMEDAEAELAAKRLDVAAKTLEMDEQIATKTRQLTELNAAILSLKAAHALV